MANASGGGLRDAREFKAGRRPLLGAFVGIAGGFASLYAYSASIFIAPLSAEFGWDRLEASVSTLAIPIATIFAAPVIGRMIDRFGATAVAIPSMLGLAFGFAALALCVSGLTSFIVVATALVLVSVASTPLSFNRIVVAHFDRHRGLALGIALTGTSVGAIFMPPLLAMMIRWQGWRAGYVLLAAVTLSAAMLTRWLLRKERLGSGTNPSMARSASPSLMQTKGFLSISIIVGLASTAVLGTMFHFVPMLIDGGMNPVRAGMLASIFGLAVLVGRIGTGILLDIGNAGLVIATLFGLCASGMFVLALGYGPVVLGAMLIGLGLGTEGDLIAYLLGRRFPLRRYSSAYGVIFAIHSVGGGTGPVIVGYFHDRTGSYQFGLLIAGAAMILAACIALATEYRAPLLPAE